ncbi:MAG TPA: hypothetical protein PLE92_05880 [Lentisphaeria bacterium]|nr:hypothetical protein [Lentisphaerota bacterium]OQC14163.1 MAG: hypothetical protein BWX73_01922 [Lentisphaerae bacterium ADurb.Bin082]HQC52644.1 hypothetical protein [Lentisphaeria bacterium]HQL87964.1 hypothetical protein [Lentisphaeria bacterium]
MKEFDRIVIGANFLGCGLAARLGRVKIIEPSCVLGADFALTFNSGEAWDVAPEHLEAAEYLSMLREHRALDDDGRTAVAAFAPLLAAWCRKRELDIELSCSVVAIEGQELRVMGVDGRKIYRAGEIYDAMPKTKPRKFLIGLAAGPAGLEDGRRGDFVFRQSLHPGEYYVKLECSGEDGWEFARRTWHQRWARRPEELRDCRLLLLGTRFDLCNYPNPVAALDAGLRGEGGKL